MEKKELQAVSLKEGISQQLNQVYNDFSDYLL